MWNQCHRFPIQDRSRYVQLSLTRKGILMDLSLFYTELLVVLIPPQNMFEIFPQISGLENIAFVKGWYWYLAIAIEAILFNLDRWRWSIIRHKNPLVKLWQISSEWYKIFNSLHHQISLQLHQKSLGEILHFRIPRLQLSVHGSSMFFLFLLSVNIHLNCQNIYDKYQLTIITWYHQNLHCCKCLI